MPEEHGFDTFVGYYDQVHAHSYFPPYLIENSEELVLEGNTGGRSGKTYAHYVIWDRGIEFIRENAKAQKPFFCYLPITPPHGMFDIPDDDPAWALYKDEPGPEEARRYAAMVTMMDRQIGELLALLKELGLEDKRETSGSRRLSGPTPSARSRILSPCRRVKHVTAMVAKRRGFRSGKPEVGYGESGGGWNGFGTLERTCCGPFTSRIPPDWG